MHLSCCLEVRCQKFGFSTTIDEVQWFTFLSLQQKSVLILECNTQVELVQLLLSTMLYWF